MNKPELNVNYAKPKKLSEVPEYVSNNAGHLVTKNSGWRNKRPVIDTDKCVGCYRCYMYCPDGVIFKDNGKVAIDYDFCKGCGICKNMCKPGAISMKNEH